ncbi:MAG TPA: FKBP-type peptidyl-prolyl cis-trans isomerase [Solirubrobacterales bacterium]|nr:FKBP-type peptidyl-prolyl cis-trans isomerase [Solirubrobacterales bacterium]
MKKLLVIGLMLAGLQLTACGGSESTDASSAKSAPETTAEEKPAAAKGPEMAYAGDWTVLKKVAGPYSKRLLIPHGPAPKQVVIRDLKIGKGPVLHHGDNYRARYVDLTYNEAYVVEPYWQSPSNYLFEWGGYKKGWEVGLRGIRVGGMRELIVPSRMAYKNGARVYIVQALKLD